MSENKSPWIKVGSINKKKSGEGFTLAVANDVKLSKGSYLVIKDVRKDIEEQIKSGKISETKGEERLAKIPDFVKYEVLLNTNNK